MQTRLTDVIAPAFYGVHRDIAAGRHTYYDLYGGRGSGKSTFAASEIVLGMMKDPAANAVVFRKYAVTLRDSVFEQIQWAISALGADSLWTCSVSPMQCVYHGRPDAPQKIIFRGLDKAKKTKSIKANRGYYKFLWFEELDEFAGPEELRTVQQSVLRGGETFVVFKTFNPPISRNNWANEYVTEPRPDSLRHRSDYRAVPEKWLGAQFLADAERLRQANEQAYRHEYLGEPVGLGTNVFTFLELRDITDEEIRGMDRIYQGLDWGFYPDPLAFVRLYYDSRQEKIYLLDELYVNRWSNRRAGDWLLERGYGDYEITCDGAEPKSVNDLRDMGLPARRAVKGPGSVEYGFKFLQVRTIVIDRRRTPNAYREALEYEFDRDAKGNLISAYPDHDNHTLDAMRYALERVSGRRGNHA
ncbi:MAG: PBSX family phage terminase large subunit [Clostridiales bacterium]|nr:PBSX family phage terminase large subunit [Clostridiales bacterium]